MIRKIKLYIKYSGGGGIEKDLIYEGDSMRRSQRALCETKTPCWNTWKRRKIMV